ncbi:cytochrome P450 [Parathielavia appendiculata]|uniref:Cytochrome P450 n=1 Tax=Parathielavia appendiculata TaxID=2587402 RepID=A0AAN6Z4V9_9PEZI|nr:cytochrome P450 [Parathielavia appendiculata]
MGLQLLVEPLFGGALIGRGSWDGRLLITAAIAVLLPFILTYIVTSLNASWVTNRGNGNPPAAPYAVPVLGNTSQFAYDTEGFITRTLRRFGSVPFRLKVGLETMYYIPYGEPVQAMFKHARDLSMKPIIIVAMRDQFGMKPADVAVYERDGSGDMAKPLEGWEHMDPAHRVFYHQHHDLNAHLSGVALGALMARFKANYTSQLATTDQAGEHWTELPDLYSFLRDHMFRASCGALLGERLFELCPDFSRDFWEFDKHLITYLRRTPRWMAPRAYAARDRVLASMKKWYTHARSQLDYRDPTLAGVEYEPVWGARLMRARAEKFDKAGFSLDGCVSMDLGFVWAGTANVIPATLWVLLNVLLSENLTGRVMAEVEECLDEATGLFDVAALCGKPLLNGLYLESLRYCAATTSARNPVVDNFKLCGWSIPRDALMMSIVWFGAHDPNFWNAGRILPSGKPEHPVDTYWAERFLEYPDDPASGPVRKPNHALYTSSSSDIRPEKTAQDDKTAKPISHTAALQGHFYPYGGGSRICPGRHLAKQELLVAVAVMMREFEIELLDPVSARRARPDMRVFPTGAMGPDRKLPIRIRRRTR